MGDAPVPPGESPRTAGAGSKITKLPSGPPPTPGGSTRAQLPGLSAALPDRLCAAVLSSPAPETGSRRGLVPIGSARDSTQKEVDQLKQERTMLKDEISTMQALAEQLVLEEKSLKDKVDVLTKESERLQKIVDKLNRDKSALELQTQQVQQQLQQQQQLAANPANSLQLPSPTPQRPLSAQGRSVRHGPDSTRGLKRSDLPPQPVAPAPPPASAEPNPNVPLSRKVGFW